jgi:hypothetical protein
MVNDNDKSTARRAGDAGSRPARLSPEGAKENTNQARWWAAVVTSALVLSALPACEGELEGDAATGAGGGGGQVQGMECSDYCGQIKAYCTGDLAQYASDEICMSTCAQFPTGTLEDTTGNTAGCRLYHAGAAAENAAEHCPHAGPGGAGFCGDDCESYCSLVLAVCAEQFDTMDTCMTACNAYPDTPPFNATIVTGDTLQCRLYHVSVATTDAATHCPHVGVTPSAGTCVDP